MGNIARSLLFPLFLLAAVSWGKVPFDRLTPHGVGLEYAMFQRAQPITDAEVYSIEKMHLISVCYAPFSFLQASLGLGADKFEVDPFQGREFKGGYGLSPAGGLYLASPPFARKRLRLNAESEFLYLNSRDGSGFRYSGPIADPSMGLTLRITPLVNLDAGARWHIINGTMTGGKAALDQPFSNSDYLRAYFALSAVSPLGVYCQVDFSASESAVSGRFKNGLEGAALGFRLGYLLEYKKSNEKIEERNDVYFPDYETMKKRQKAMAEEIK